MSLQRGRLVMGFGTFDAVHPGHLFYMQELRKLGDRLLIVIARDANVERIKVKAPHFDEGQRQKAILETGLADEVILGHETDFFKVLRDHKPSVLGFGYDQRVDIEELKAKFPEIEMVRLESHHPHKYKSSIIKAEMFG